MSPTSSFGRVRTGRFGSVRPRGALVASLVIVAALATACGSSTSSTKTDTTSKTSSDQTGTSQGGPGQPPTEEQKAAFEAWRKCLSEHGVTLPDPPTTPPTAPPTERPAPLPTEAAEACASLRPQRPGGPPSESPTPGQ